MLPYVGKVNIHQDVVYVACSVFVVFSSIKNRDHRGHDRMVVGLTTTYAINVVTTGVEYAHDEVFSILHYVIKFVSDLWQVSGFHRGFPPPIKLTSTI